MSDEFEFVLITTDGREATGDSVAAGEQTASRDKIDASREHSGLVLETVRDAWIYCNASKKMVAGNQMLPWLSGGAAAVSAITGVALFATLQENPATWARVAVASVAVLTALITGLQTWAASRIKSLNDQALRFHQFHREVMGDIVAGRDLGVDAYAEEREADLQKLMAGISEPSEHAWAKAEKNVDAKMKRLFPRLFPGGQPATP